MHLFICLKAAERNTDDVTTASSTVTTTLAPHVVTSTLMAFIYLALQNLNYMYKEKEKNKDRFTKDAEILEHSPFHASRCYYSF